MTRAKLAISAGISKTTIERFEAGRQNPHQKTLDKLRRALEGAGVEFMAGGWVRLKPEEVSQESPT